MLAIRYVFRIYEQISFVILKIINENFEIGKEKITIIQGIFKFT